MESSFGSIYWFLTDKHSFLAAKMQHLSTGYISPQFHLVFDDLFETVICQGYNESKIEAICSDIFDVNRYWYAEDQFDDARNLIY